MVLYRVSLLLDLGSPIRGSEPYHGLNILGVATHWQGVMNSNRGCVMIRMYFRAGGLRDITYLRKFSSRPINTEMNLVTIAQ